METIQSLLQYLLHIDTYLIAFVTHYGVWTYALLFLIIFCETGLVVTPFLPGDSLLFAAGSIAANANGSLSVELLILLLIIASILGNKVNYLIGRTLGQRLFSTNKQSRSLQNLLLNRKYLEQAHEFYEKHGGKTIILARFVPIIRTFAPFVAGMGYMGLKQFSFYNVVSAVLWIVSLVGAGYFFGSLPVIRDNFSIVVYGIIVISLLPPLAAFVYKKIFSAKVRSY